MSENLHLEKVIGVNGNMITVEFTAEVMQNEVAYVKSNNTMLSLSLAMLFLTVTVMVLKLA